MAGAEQPALVEHPGQGAHGEGAAAEPEQVDAVAFLVAAHQAAVGVLDVLLQAVPGGLVAHGAEIPAPLVVLPASRCRCRGRSTRPAPRPFRRARRSPRRWCCCFRIRCRSRRSRRRCSSSGILRSSDGRRGERQHPPRRDPGPPAILGYLRGACRAGRRATGGCIRTRLRNRRRSPARTSARRRRLESGRPPLCRPRFRHRLHAARRTDGA